MSAEKGGGCSKSRCAFPPVDDTQSEAPGKREIEASAELGGKGVGGWHGSRGSRERVVKPASHSEERLAEQPGAVPDAEGIAWANEIDDLANAAAPGEARSMCPVRLAATPQRR